MRIVQRSVLPGFGITMGFTITYLCLIVLIPLSGLFVVTADVSFAEIKQIMSNLLVKRAFYLTFRSSFIAACVNAFFGLVVAWTLVRYRFVGRRILDAMVDLPFALPTVVSGVALARLYSDSGWLGRAFAENGSGTRFLHNVGSWLQATGLPGVESAGAKLLASDSFPIRNTEFGITLALIFIGLASSSRLCCPRKSAGSPWRSRARSENTAPLFLSAVRCPAKRRRFHTLFTKKRKRTISSPRRSSPALP